MFYISTRMSRWSWCSCVFIFVLFMQLWNCIRTFDISLFFSCIYVLFFRKSMKRLKPGQSANDKSDLVHEWKHHWWLCTHEVSFAVVVVFDLCANACVIYTQPASVVGQTKSLSYEARVLGFSPHQGLDAVPWYLTYEFFWWPVISFHSLKEGSCQ